MQRVLIVLALALGLTGAAAGSAAAQSPDPRVERLEEEVRHQLWMLPYFGVFDNLAYKVEPGGTVTLSGQVRQATLKQDAEARVKRIPGVDNVANEIEILPVSPMDDRIRLRTYRAIYRTGALERYAIQAVPPIHIIVKNGHVTLEGAVASEMDKNLANIKARGVGGVFSVTNNLRVAP